jgi:hypothetical protein
LHSHSHVFCLNVVWRVHWLLIDEATFILLQGTAYGRYHAVSLTMALCCPVRLWLANVDTLTWRPFKMVNDESYIRVCDEFKPQPPCQR